MICRCVLLFLWLICLLFPAYTQDSFSTLYIQTVAYKGPDKQFGKTISALVKEEFLLYGLFEIAGSKNEAWYILSCTIEEKNDDFILRMEINGTAANTIREIVVKKDRKENGIKILLKEAVEYLHRKIFPFEIYSRKNGPFFTERTMKSDSIQDIIDRESNKTGNPINITPSPLFVPLNKELFEKHRFQLFPSLDVSFPVNLLDDDVKQAPYVHFPFNYYIFTTKIIMLSLLAEGTYFTIRKQVSLDAYNTLHVTGIGAGAGVCYPLPFYNRASLRLNISGGGFISIIVSDYLPERISVSFDPYFHPGLEFEQSITKNFSISVTCSYIWIFYSNEHLHLIQTGMGLGYRF